MAVSMMTPDPGKTVGLQFLAHRQLILPGFGQALLLLAYLCSNTQQGLQVMADLVRDDIGLGKVARGLVAGFQVMVERQVDIHLAVSRTIKGANSGIGRTAGRLYVIAEQHQFWRLVALAFCSKNL